jgi:hypothetical protein
MDSIHHWLEFALDEHIDGPTCAQLRIPSMNPDLDALGPVHVLQLTHDVVDIDEPISGLGGGARAACCPVLYLAFPHTGNLPDLGCGQPTLSDLVN